MREFFPSQRETDLVFVSLCADLRRKSRPFCERTSTVIAGKQEVRSEVSSQGIEKEFCHQDAQLRGKSQRPQVANPVAILLSASEEKANSEAEEGET